MLPYKVIVSNKTFNYSGTTGSGEASFEFLSLSDAKAFATALVAKYSYVIVYIWDGSGILQYIAVNKNGLVLWSEFDADTQTFPSTGSAEFNGTSDYIQLDTPFSYTNHTIAAWVYANDTGSIKFIFDNRDADNDGLVLFLTNSEQLSYSLNTTDLTTTDTFANEWFFATITYDGTTAKMYIDGSVNQSTAASQTVSVTPNARIGARVPISAAFNMDGNLANVAIWNRALSSDEINSVMWKGYNALATTEKSGLQAWYKLEESELFDASNTSTTNLEEYAKLNSVTFEGKACLQTALNALPDITDARLYSGRYDARVSGDGGTVEALNCVETELNALL